jgi:hypothetical protein
VSRRGFKKCSRSAIALTILFSDQLSGSVSLMKQSKKFPAYQDNQSAPTGVCTATSKYLRSKEEKKGQDVPDKYEYPCIVFVARIIIVDVKECNIHSQLSLPRKGYPMLCRCLLTTCSGMLIKMLFFPTKSTFMVLFYFHPPVDTSG